ncbi:MAG: ribonuclease PH [Actinomycetota bacterium]|nr:ribonuclease PH [Actinomycetota bacterium]
MRTDGRAPEELRPVKITRDYIPHAEGSCLIETGRTRVVCTATFEEGVPAFLRGTEGGWITAEYSMLPRATETRSTREAALGRVGGRTAEIQRIIGRSLRGAFDLNAFPNCTFVVDCDVIEADGGTRTASITGAFVALFDAFDTMIERGVLEAIPTGEFLAAVSAGIVTGVPCLDLCFEEDFHAAVDMNLVALESGRIIEIQATSEKKPLERSELEELIELSLSGIQKLIACQHEVLELPRKRE